jgi:hypothetical protein
MGQRTDRPPTRGRTYSQSVLWVCNSDFLDRSLPRNAIQAVVASFHYDRGIERGEKLFYGSAAAGEATHLGVWRMKKESRWSALKELMAEPRR